MDDIVLKSAKLIAKKSLIVVLVFIVIAFTSAMYFFLYNGDYTKFTLTDFTKPRVITLRPHKYWPYAITKIKIKGYVNDTIVVINEGYVDNHTNDKKEVRSINKKKELYGNHYLLFRKIDTVLQSEFYGGSTEPIFFVIYPYKATRGKIDIEIQL